MTPRVRVDQLVVERGLAPSRERARALILAGQVSVDGRIVGKAGAQVSPEADLAGYHVYRSEQRGTEVSPMERLTREWLLTPTFRDISIEPGRRYLYRVSAVDRAGNESPLSITVSAEVPQREP